MHPFFGPPLHNNNIIDSSAGGHLRRLCNDTCTHLLKYVDDIDFTHTTRVTGYRTPEMFGRNAFRVVVSYISRRAFDEIVG